MPFDQLPGANLNTSAMSNLRPFVRPARPIFPTYEVTMNALNSILPALDPVNRAKREEAMMNLQLAKAKMPLEQQKIDYEKQLYGIQQGYLKSGKIPPGYVLDKNGMMRPETPAEKIQREKWETEQKKNADTHSTDPNDYASAPEDAEDDSNAFGGPLSGAGIPGQ